MDVESALKKAQQCICVRDGIAAFLRNMHEQAEGAHFEIPGDVMFYTGHWNDLADYIDELAAQ